MDGVHPDPEYAEYMLFPRLIAVAETAWTPQADRNFEEFKQRMEAHKKRLDYLKVNHYGAPINGDFQYQMPKKTASK